MDGAVIDEIIANFGGYYFGQQSFIISMLVSSANPKSAYFYEEILRDFLTRMGNGKVNYGDGYPRIQNVLSVADLTRYLIVKEGLTGTMEKFPNLEFSEKEKTDAEAKAEAEAEAKAEAELAMMRREMWRSKQ